MSDEVFLVLRPSHHGGPTGLVAKSTSEADEILETVTGESGRFCNAKTSGGGHCRRPGVAALGGRCHLHMTKKAKVKTVRSMSTKQGIKLLRKAARVAPAGSVERARCEQLRTFLVLRSTYAPLTKAIPPDQAQAIHLAVADAQARAVPGASAGGTRVTSGASGAEAQLRGIVAGTGPRGSLAGTADAQAVARMQTNPTSGMGFIKQLDSREAASDLVKAEAGFVEARQEGNAAEIARAGEALTLARLRALHAGGR